VFCGIFPDKLTRTTFASFQDRIESFIEVRNQFYHRVLITHNTIQTIGDKDRVASDLEKKFSQLAENLYDFVKVIEKAVESTVQKQIGLDEQLAHLYSKRIEIVQCIESYVPHSEPPGIASSRILVFTYRLAV
jgi:hypothetical protein